MILIITSSSLAQRLPRILKDKKSKAKALNLSSSSLVNQLNSSRVPFDRETYNQLFGTPDSKPCDGSNAITSCEDCLLSHCPKHPEH